MFGQKIYDTIIKVGEDDSGKPIIPIYATRKLAIDLKDICVIIEGTEDGEVGIYLDNGQYFCVKADFELIVVSWKQARNAGCCKE